MMAILVEHWQQIVLALLGVAEVVALFIPGAQGTVKTLGAAVIKLGIKK